MNKLLNTLFSWLLLCSSWLVLAGMVASKLFELPLIDELEYKVFDTYQQVAPRAYEPAGVRIVDIDDESLARYGQWPWPRSVMAELTEKLYAAGAAVVAYDIIFPEADRTAPKQLLPLWNEPALKSILEKLPDPDAQFAAALEGKSAVTSVMLSNRSNANIYEYDKASILIRGELPDDALRRFDGMIGTLPILTNAAAGVGLINSIPDRDGILRRVPLFLKYKEQPYPTIGLESLRLALGESRYMLNAPAGLESVSLGATEIPVDEHGMFWIYYTQTQKDRYLPAWQVMDASADTTKLEGHIVLIGTSAAGLKDLRTTPHDAALPGVEVHAQLIEQIVLKQFLGRPGWIFGAEIVGLIVLGLLLLAIGRMAGPLIGFTSMLVLVGLVIAGSWHAFTYWHLLINPVTPVLTALLMYMIESARRFLKTEQQRKQIRDAFSLYLSPSLVAKAVAHPKRLKLGGENRELTVMFTDIRDFSSYSEGQSPEELTQFINDFLTPMTNIILEKQGTIDKYIGDCIMAFWNAPLDVEHHAAHAARAALAMRDALVIFNSTLASSLPPVRMGIGLNTGICCVGNLGSKSRFNYSALGNPVDLASRLEGQSKLYGVDIVIGEATHAQLPGFVALELDLIRVKGKKKAMHIYTLLGEGSAENPAHQAMLAAYRSQDWAAARRHLKEAEQASPASLTALYTLYRERIDAYEITPPPLDWDGVYVATFK